MEFEEIEKLCYKKKLGNDFEEILELVRLGLFDYYKTRKNAEESFKKMWGLNKKPNIRVHTLEYILLWHLKQEVEK